MPEIVKTDRKKLDEWEEKLREQVGEGGLLLGELGDIKANLDEIGVLLANTAFYHLRRKSYTIEQTLQQVHLQWPLTFAFYLVLEGIYNYTGDDLYWHGPMNCLGLQSNHTDDCGQLFLDTLAQFDLPTFPFAEGHKYVTRILLHGGIPNQFLPDLFDFLWRIEVQPHQIAPDVELLLQRWQQNPEDHLSYLRRAVQRFLRYGESVAADFVERCLDLFATESLDEALELIDLPRRVIKEYWGWREEKGLKPKRRQQRVRLLKPILTLAPYTSGIAIYLPDQQFPNQLAPDSVMWQVQGTGVPEQSIATIRSRIEGGYQYAAEAITAVSPAPAYAIQLIANEKPLQTWTLPGFDAPPILFFAPYGDYEGDALTGPERFYAGERWLLYPENATWKAQGNSHKLGDLPRLPGEWGQYRLEKWQLGPGEMILQTADGRSHPFTIAQETARQKPYLTENGRLPLPTAAKEFPLYVGRPPHLIVPTRQPQRWHLTLRAAGQSQPGGERHQSLARLSPVQEGDMVRLDLASPRLLGNAPVGKFELVLRGPLGQSYSLGLRVIPSLTIEGLNQLLIEEADQPARFTFTSDTATDIRQSPPQAGVTLRPIAPIKLDERRYLVEAQTAVEQLTLQIRHESGVVIPLAIPIHRLRWGVYVGEGNTPVTWYTSPANIYPGSLLQVDAALWVDVPVIWEYRLHVGWQLINETGEVLDHVRPGEKPVQRRWEVPLGRLTAVWRERQETLCWQLIIHAPDRDEPLRIPAFFLLPTLDFGDLAYEWAEEKGEVCLTLTWEQAQPGSYQLHLWPLDRPWVQEPIVLRLPKTAVSLAEWRLPASQLPAEAYLAELLVHNPWRSATPQRPLPDQPNTLLIKPPALTAHYEEIARLRDQGQATIEQLLALLAHEFYNNKQHELFTTNKAIADQRDKLTLTWLVRWLELAATLNSTAYKLAQIRAFDQAIIERLAKEFLPEDELARYFKHMPEKFSEKLWLWVLQSGLPHARIRCLQELCQRPLPPDGLSDSFQIALQALLDDVANGSLLFNEAVSLLQPNAQAAADFLAQAGSRDAQELLMELASQTGLEPNWVAPGMQLETNLGVIQVERLRWRTTNETRFCVPLRADCYVDGKLSAETAVAIRLDLRNKLLLFQNIEPYLCLHCQQLFSSVTAYQQHHETNHIGENLSRKRLKQRSLNLIQPRLAQNNEEGIP